MRSVNPNTGVKGMDIILSNLNKQIKLIKERTMKGFMEASTVVRNDMDTTSPLIPVDTNNLRASWHVDPFYKGESPGIVMGFSANYAVYVHEMFESSTGKAINWKRPDSGPKFFEASLKRNKDEILKVIRDNAKIP